MTVHGHRSLVPGCYRCELSEDEASRPYVAYAIGGTYNRGFAFEAIVDLPAMQPGDSVRVEMRADGSVEVVRLRNVEVDTTFDTFVLWQDTHGDPSKASWLTVWVDPTTTTYEVYVDKKRAEAGDDIDSDNERTER